MSKFKKISKNIQQVVISNPEKTEAVTWTNINGAGKDEIEYLRKQYGFLKLQHLRAASAKANSQRPMIVREEDYVFLIMHFLIPGKITAGGSIANGVASTEIEFFIGHGWVVTMPGQPVETLDNFFNLCKKDGNSLLSYKFESSAILLYEILKKLLDSSYEILDSNSIAISLAEKTVLGDDQKKSADLILNLRHNLINMRKITQNHKNIIKHIMAMESGVVSPKHLKKYYGEIIEQTKNIWEIMENQREMVEVLYDSYHSLANYQMGNTMKTLTIFYVTFSSLSLVAAIFSVKAESGMPFINQENGFLIILGIMGVVGLLMILLFQRKRWL